MHDEEPDCEVHFEPPDHPKHKKQRGPTKMRHIAKDPNTREKVEFTEM